MKGGEPMSTSTQPRKKFDLDVDGFLVDPQKWDPALAEQLAPQMGIADGLTKEHWDVINYIRRAYEKTGKCPNLFETCREINLRRAELKRLFPKGYMRGACKLAGISYKEAYLGADYLEHSAVDLHAIAQRQEYRVDVRGFLVDPDEWDEHYAGHRAFEMKIPGGKLTKMHWQIIRYLRTTFYKTGKVPTAAETCEANDLEIGELEALFPDGYHRGAVKIAGLRVR
jgi:tRNA 2-thiouridine synthesizing protein E